MDLRITFKGIEHSQAVVDKVHEKARRLERFSSHILNVHVFIEAPHRRHHKGNVFANSGEISNPMNPITLADYKTIPSRALHHNRRPGHEVFHSESYLEQAHAHAHAQEAIHSC